MNSIRKGNDFKYQKLIVLTPPIVEKLPKNILTQNIYVTDIGFYPNALYHFRERKNGDPSYIFILCVDGEGYYKIDNKKPVLLKKGSLLVIPKNTPHQYWAGSKNPWSIYFFHINGKLAGEYCKRIMPHYDIPLTLDVTSKMIRLFDECYDTMKNASTEMEYVLATKAAEYFVALATTCVTPKTTSQNSCDEKAVRDAISYMSDHIMQSVTLHDICSTAGYSPSYFASVFKRATGYPPIDYFLRLKIQDSCTYLDSSTLSIKEVSEKFQFSDQFYFSKLFKKIIGSSPSNYRKRNDWGSDSD